MINRARAFGVLLLPVLVLGAFIALGFTMHTGERGVLVSVAPRTQEGDALSSTSAEATIEVRQRLEGAPGKGATTVTTYTITGKY